MPAYFPASTRFYTPRQRRQARRQLIDYEKVITLYRNLRAEMARQGLTGKQIAAAIEISPRAFSRRMTGKTEFELLEIKKLRNIFFSEHTFEYLFESD
ncbi:MAG: hypothetical protein A4E56_02942 [Pelotomaculum sp. PtaU1.Bin065]|nr:MAG: hypothetical protein A4E56_02942 [Pelotomaculum sp. PtaU1.Bin065]